MSGRVISIVVTVLAGIFVALNLHELGHTAVAWLAGDHHASYQLHCQPAGFGCNHFDPSGMSTTAKAMVTLGGVAVTQVITWSLFALRRRAGRRARPVLTALVAVFAVDLFLQFLQAVLTPLPEYDLTKVDFAALATLLGWSQAAARAAFVGGAVAYAAAWATVVMVSRGRRAGRSRRPVG